MTIAIATPAMGRVTKMAKLPPDTGTTNRPRGHSDSPPAVRTMTTPMPSGGGGQYAQGLHRRRDRILEPAQDLPAPHLPDEGPGTLPGQSPPSSAGGCPSGGSRLPRGNADRARFSRGSRVWSPPVQDVICTKTLKRGKAFPGLQDAPWRDRVLRVDSLHPTHSRSITSARPHEW